MLTRLRSGLKVKYIGEFQGQLKTGDIVTVDQVEISYGSRVGKWFVFLSIKEKDDHGETITLPLDVLVPQE
jgi:hypothetical protein